jgi:heme exporter protein A
MATHIDLGIPEAEVFDVTPFRARPRVALADEAFL